MIDGSALREGERFKCQKCKKLMTFGPDVLDPRQRGAWQTGRAILLMVCIGATIWCVTLGYSFGLWNGEWMTGFGGALGVWSVGVGCIVLAAATTQNNGVVVGVAMMMAGVELFFLERLGRKVGYPVDAWREFRYYEWWVPGVIAAGLMVLAAALVVQARRRSV